MKGPTLSAEAFYLSLVFQCCLTAVTGRKVLLVSMDGFRYDYLQKGANTPNFDAMIASGVQVPYVNTTFVTSTFPSHTSIITGLYAESHGIVSNKFYDPIYDSNFTKRSHDPKWWNSSEPIWINAVRSGLKVGIFFWPGSEVPHDKLLPTEYRMYDGKVPFLDRVQTVVRWLSRDDYDFAILYFNEPDYSGHVFGPDSPQIVPAIERMDSVLGNLMESLQNASIKDKVDVIVTSDHGMASVDRIKKVIQITDFVAQSLLKWAIPEQGAVMHLVPKPGKAQELVNALRSVEHLHVFLKEDIPERFHYKNNRRIMPVFAFADEGWIISATSTPILIRGGHGYDNDLMSMTAIFVASGPSFKKGHRLPEPIKSVDIYPLLCYLLGLSPAPNNGSLERVMPLLESTPDNSSVLRFSLILVLNCIIISWMI